MQGDAAFAIRSHAEPGSCSAARLILRKRTGDGADHAEPHLGVDFVMNDAAGWWRQDPISLVPIIRKDIYSREAPAGGWTAA